jgi:hypothetical protein
LLPSHALSPQSRKTGEGRHSLGQHFSLEIADAGKRREGDACLAQLLPFPSTLALETGWQGEQYLVPFDCQLPLLIFDIIQSGDFE